MAAALCVNTYAYGKVSTQSHSGQLDLGYEYLAETEYEQAQITFEDIISVDETNYEAYLGLAQVYAAMGEPEEARKIMEEAVRSCEYGEIQARVIEAQAGLRQFKSMAGYNSGFESVSGLTDFCVQGLDLFLGWIEKASTVIDGASSALKSFAELFS